MSRVMLVAFFCLFLYVAQHYQYQVIQQQPSMEIHLISRRRTTAQDDLDEVSPL